MKTLKDWQNEIGDWGDRTFNHHLSIGALNGCINHLKKEVEELNEAVLCKGLSNDAAPECADIFILLCSICRLLDFDLDTVVKWKMDINRNRVWGQPNKDGVVEHIDTKGTNEQP